MNFGNQFKASLRTKRHQLNMIYFHLMPSGESWLAPWGRPIDHAHQKLCIVSLGKLKAAKYHVDDKMNGCNCEKGPQARLKGTQNASSQGPVPKVFPDLLKLHQPISWELDSERKGFLLWLRSREWASAHQVQFVGPGKVTVNATPTFFPN